MAIKPPAPPTYSKGFNLQDAFLGVIGSGQYDNVLVSNGSQKVQLTKFGGTGQSPEAIHLQGGGQNLSVAPVNATTGSLTLGAGGKIDLKAQSSLQSGTLERPVTIGVIVIGAAVLAFLIFRKPKG